jgi:hypothetical protein
MSDALSVKSSLKPKGAGEFLSGLFYHESMLKHGE